MAETDGPAMLPTVQILILAAGASARMRGSDKLLQLIGGKPILRHVAEQALSSGAPVTVTLPLRHDRRCAALAGLELRIVEVPDADQGMSRSLRRGLAAIADGAGTADGVMILPADMPGFTAAALTGLIGAYQADPTRILRGAAADGQPGHPAIIPRDLWPELAAVEGDEGGRSVLARHGDRIRLIPLAGDMAVLDLDTPEDWAGFRSDPSRSGRE